VEQVREKGCTSTEYDRSTGQQEQGRQAFGATTVNDGDCRAALVVLSPGPVCKNKNLCKFERWCFEPKTETIPLLGDKTVHEVRKKGKTRDGKEPHSRLCCLACQTVVSPLLPYGRTLLSRICDDRGPMIGGGEEQRVSPCMNLSTLLISLQNPDSPPWHC
jgi:hypothetical protein